MPDVGSQDLVIIQCSTLSERCFKMLSFSFFLVKTCVERKDFILWCYTIRSSLMWTRDDTPKEIHYRPVWEFKMY